MQDKQIRFSFHCKCCMEQMRPGVWDLCSYINSPSKPHPIYLMQIKRPYWNCQVPNLVFVTDNWNHSSLPPAAPVWRRGEKKNDTGGERQTERNRERDNCLIRQWAVMIVTSHFQQHPGRWYGKAQVSDLSEESCLSLSLSLWLWSDCSSCLSLGLHVCTYMYV